MYMGSFVKIWAVKMMSNDAEIAQKPKSMLILGGYDVIRGPKKVLG